jgi:HrpA-like RNA helicase
VAYLEKSELGKKVGFRHGLAGKTSDDSKIIYVTDGWMQTKELVERTDPNDIVFGDEVHARTVALDLWRAYDKYQRRLGASRPKTVYASATVSGPALSKYHNNAPVIECEGRCFPITMRPAGETVALDALALAREGKNVLVFLYGVPHIDQVKKEIQEHLKKLHEQPLIEVVPLHSKLSGVEQQQALRSYSHPKIVLATNCAEVGITIEDIDAVVCSGLVRRSRRNTEGVTTLGIGPSTQDEIKQQIGRAGRVKPGIAIVHIDDISKLEEHDLPEIVTTSLMPWILKMEAAKLPFHDLVPFLQDVPPASHVADDYQALYKLGLLLKNGRISELGKRVVSLPVHPRYGKMIVEAIDLQRQRGVDIVPLVVDMVSVMEAEGLNSPVSSEWKNFCSTGHASTPIAQLELFYNVPQKIWSNAIEQIIESLDRRLPQPVERALRKIAITAPIEVLIGSGDSARAAERYLFERFESQLGGRAKDELLSVWGPIVQRYHEIRDHQLATYGLSPTSLARALTVRQELRRRLKLSQDYTSKQGYIKTPERDDIQRCIWSAHLDQMFYRCGRDEKGMIVYKPFGGGDNAQARMLASDSVVKESPFVCGEPVNIGVLNEQGKQTFRTVIAMSTAIEREWLSTRAASVESVQKVVREALKATPGESPKRKEVAPDARCHRIDSVQRSGSNNSHSR